MTGKTIEIYADPGKPCLKCKRWFQNSQDFAGHKCKTQAWRKSKYDNTTYILPAEDDPKLARQIRMDGVVVLGGYAYRFSTDGVWIKRKPQP